MGGTSGSSAGNVSLWKYEVVIVLIVLLSAVLAYLLDALEHYTRSHPMAARVVEHVYEEVTLLGLISLLLYAFQDAVIEAMGGPGPSPASITERRTSARSVAMRSRSASANA